MTALTEDTGRRIADTLDKVAHELAVLRILMQAAPMLRRAAVNPNRCTFCGGYHGGDVICPALVPAK